jgi:hypothetical protein
MSRPHASPRRWWLAGLLLAASLLPAASPAANKIVLVADTQSAGQQAAAEGFLAGLGLAFNPAPLQYPLGGGYAVEIETNPKNLIAQTQDANVLALLCVTSSACLPATEAGAAKDLLVIALAATSSYLLNDANVLRLAPSNVHQAYALYKRLKAGIGGGRFAVVYEPDVYGTDLYDNFIRGHLTNVLYQHPAPRWVMALPLHTHLPLAPGQKDLDAAKILRVLAGQSLDAVLYLGAAEGFLDLTDAARGGKAGVVPRWYASDAAALSPDKGFAGLEIISLPGSQRAYGQDAAQFLIQAATQYLQQGGGERGKLLEIAKTVTSAGSTGAKGFEAVDSNPVFNALLYKAVGVTESVPVSGTLFDEPQE